MSTADWLLVVMWIGLTAYVLFGGADFGGGFWDVPDRRELIDHAMGPVWEANHVWLIFVIVLCWTCFPGVFASVASTMYIPLTLVAVGIIARGSTFAFRKVSDIRFYNTAFKVSSVLTPFFLGTIAGGIASGRVPYGIAGGNVLTSWTNPTSALGGCLAVGVAAYLAAVYLCGDARRERRADLVAVFRTRAIITAIVTGAVALAGIWILYADSPALFRGLTGRALPLVILSAVGGLTSLVLVWRRLFVLARVAAGVAVTGVLWGWAVAQYPIMLYPDTTVDVAAAYPVVLRTVLVCVAAASFLLVPSLIWLYSLFQRDVRA
jgi:cytochrome d ubiquinol oxidase subunit II